MTDAASPADAERGRGEVEVEGAGASGAGSGVSQEASMRSCPSSMDRVGHYHNTEPSTPFFEHGGRDGDGVFVSE
eukprot:CAMPEP_0181304706 /NCGR_PEP_ID=MMETSP1101-20121128/9304_1 /TAXON_ID=46948 /ORGANISM="Rhodomonas abbreviata, Strain Caron Lab Isolate" /LENGTH=74 /DNA_ID=CAMNT_0023410503 /DNA_START=164 /DNA_END=389 /DNA_ORIENTATION=+